MFVCRALCTDHTVLWQIHFSTLQPFLQFGFGIFANRLHGRVDFHRLEQALHQTLRHKKTGVKINRPNNGFQGIGQNGGTLLPSRAGLTFTQAQNIGQAQHDGQLVQGILLDQIGPYPGQIAFRQRAQTGVQQIGHGQIQDRITQKLKPLIVIC